MTAEAEILPVTGVKLKPMEMNKKKEEAYKIVIGYLEHDLDYKAIVYSIAKIDPVALVRAIDEGDFSKPKNIESVSAPAFVTGSIEHLMATPFEGSPEGLHNAIIELAKNKMIEMWNGEYFEKKIQIIKEVRAMTGLGLKETKDFVDGFLNVGQMMGLLKK